MFRFGAENAETNCDRGLALDERGDITHPHSTGKLDRIVFLWHLRHYYKLRMLIPGVRQGWFLDVSGVNGSI